VKGAKKTAQARYASDYGAGIVSASTSVLVEVIRCLGDYRDLLVLLGGWAPYYILQRFQDPSNPFRHVGSVDVDIAIHPDLIREDKYASIVEILTRRDYFPRRDRLGNVIEFSFQRRTISNVDNNEYVIQLDFLTPEYPEIGKRHRRVQLDLRARTSYGCEVVFSHYFEHEVQGVLPYDGETSVRLKIADIIGLLTTKGILLGRRYREKDAYDIYSVVSNYRGGPKDVASEVKRFLTEKLVKEGVQIIKEKFRSQRAEGPSWVGTFLYPTDMGARERVQTDAFFKVNDFIKLVES